MNRLTVTRNSFLAKNTIVVFDYKSKKTGSQDTRSVVVTETDATHIQGFDFLRGGEYRKFLRSNIVSDIDVWGMRTPLPGTE